MTDCWMTQFSFTSNKTTTIPFELKSKSLKDLRNVFLLFILFYFMDNSYSCSGMLNFVMVDNKGNKKNKSEACIVYKKG